MRTEGELTSPTTIDPDTTLDPDTRRLLPVLLGAINFGDTEALITKLMGKGEAAARRELMELHGDSVEVDV